MMSQNRQTPYITNYINRDPLYRTVPGTVHLSTQLPGISGLSPDLGKAKTTP